MSTTSGIKSNKCFQTGLQGVERQVIYGSASPDQIFAMNSPQNNYRYVIREYSNVFFGMLELPPEPYFNFQVTFKNSTGFYGLLDANFSMSDSDVSGTGNMIKIYWDNPNFDVSNDYTVLHIHIWHDGIHYCGHIEGYVEET